ncbi:hypothetical protein KDA08_02440 [Candidatus Saccharibacteria bacterium]|nr:hypothetical protein [Candidatus Saccharibacteria bacterium]
MEALVKNFGIIIQGIVLFLSVTTLLAHIVSRILIKGVKDDEIVDKYSSWIWKAINWLPTAGINPRTAKLEEAYKDLKEQVKSKE